MIFIYKTEKNATPYLEMVSLFNFISVLVVNLFGDRICEQLMGPSQPHVCFCLHVNESLAIIFYKDS